MSALNVNVNDVFALESPLYRAEGITETFTLKIVGGGTLSSVTAKAYKKKVDLTTTVFPSGSITTAGNVATLKPATGFVGNGIYTIAVTCTEGGNVHVYKFDLHIQKAVQVQ